jgi:hypothetical protein
MEKLDLDSVKYKICMLRYDVNDGYADYVFKVVGP